MHSRALLCTSMFQFLNANLLASPWYFFCALTRPEIDNHIFLSWYNAMDDAYKMHGWVDPNNHAIAPALLELYDTKESFIWKDLRFTQLTEVKNLRYKRRLAPLGIIVPEPKRTKPASATKEANQPNKPRSVMSSVYRTEWPGIFDD